MSFAGEPLLGIQVVFPNLLPQGLLLSYAGNIHFNMVLQNDALGTDGASIIRQAWRDELQDMGEALGVPCTEADMFDSSAQFMCTS